MAYKLAYAIVPHHPRKVIHVVRVLGKLLPEIDVTDLSARMRERALNKNGEPDAAVVVVQGEGKETLRLFGEPYAVAHVRAAMFNAAIRWQPFEL